MRRREFLFLSVCALSGCVSGERNAPSGSDGVALSSEDLTTENPDVSLVVEYSAEIVDAIRTPDGGTREAPEGSAYLLVHTRITNLGDSERRLTAEGYVVRAGGETYEPVLTDERGYVGGDVIPPGVSADGSLVFEVPEGTTEGVLTARREAFDASVSVEFSMSPEVEGVFD